MRKPKREGWTISNFALLLVLKWLMASGRVKHTWEKTHLWVGLVCNAAGPQRSRRENYTPENWWGAEGRGGCYCAQRKDWVWRRVTCSFPNEREFPDNLACSWARRRTCLALPCFAEPCSQDPGVRTAKLHWRVQRSNHVTVESIISCVEARFYWEVNLSLL